MYNFLKQGGWLKKFSSTLMFGISDLVAYLPTILIDPIQSTVAQLYNRLIGENQWLEAAFKCGLIFSQLCNWSVTVCSSSDACRFNEQFSGLFQQATLQLKTTTILIYQ